MTQPDPQAFMTRHAVGDVVDGQVVEHVPFGAFVELGQGVHGLLHHIELRGGDAPAIGTAVRVEILAMDPDRNRVALRPA
ncbi:MAG TPA: S1 RNA-binding domain-containing protein [Acidimicrobiales bacterium]